MTRDKTSCGGACGKACKCASAQGSPGHVCPCRALADHLPPAPTDLPVSQPEKARRLERVYICHPFAGDLEANTGRVRAICRALVESGLLPVAPQLYLPQFIDEATDRDRALRLCLGLLEVCSQVQVYGSRISPGMRLEIDHAEALGIPVRFVDLEVA